MPSPADLRPRRRDDLRADCSRCVALCCVVPAFSASADFAIDKPAGQPCPHLQGDFRCGIHERLRPAGFPGCAVFDCFGAGQRVAQDLFPGRDWQRTPEVAPQMFRVFGVLRALHELLWYLHTAVALAPADLRDEVADALAVTADLAGGDPDALAALDVAAHRDRVNTVLRRVSGRVRGASGRSGADHRGADLIGRDLRRHALRAADLRGALLLGADLRGVDLALADLTGADLRGADLRGADLSGSLFVTQPQVDAARGDDRTRLPDGLRRPRHWLPAVPAPRRGA